MFSFHHIMNIHELYVDDFQQFRSHHLFPTPLTCRLKVEQGLRPGSVAGVEGVWITGQDVTTNGFAGALMGGVVTAHGILGYGFMDLALCGREPWAKGAKGFGLWWLPSGND
jgi:hypothetical protein